MNGAATKAVPGSAAVENPQELLETAVRAAREAGALLKGGFGADTVVDREPEHDVKLAVDRAAEELVRGAIGRRFPDHSLIAEESGYSAGPGVHTWVIDPLDGTVNFFHGIPHFCVSIACFIRRTDAAGSPGEPLLGVVYDPMRDELFTAVRGSGAELNGNRLEMKPLHSMGSAIVGLAFGARPAEAEKMAALLPRLLSSARKVRCMGSTALDMAHAAAGRLGAFFQLGTNLWDYAAAALIAREAGAAVQDREVDGGRFEVLVSNPGILDELSEVLRRFHVKDAQP